MSSKNLNDVILKQFCEVVGIVMATEETMADYWSSKLPIAFDRTDHARQFVWTIFSDIFESVKRERPVTYDGILLSKQLANTDLLDYNIASQCILNLQAAPQFQFDLDSLRRDIMETAADAVKLGSPDPLVKGKIDKSESPWSETYNKAVNLVAIERIAGKFSNNISWRLSAKNQTPALADSQNMSMLRFEVEKYMKLHQPHHKLLQLLWPTEFTVPMQMENSDGWIAVPKIHTKFFSKSGGDILGRSLLARKLTVFAYAYPEVLNVYPRLNSLTIIGNDSMPDSIMDDFQRAMSKSIDIGEL